MEELEKLEDFKRFFENESKIKLETFKQNLGEKLKPRYNNFKGLIACDSKDIEDYRFVIRAIFEELKESGIWNRESGIE